MSTYQDLLGQVDRVLGRQAQAQQDLAMAEAQLAATQIQVELTTQASTILADYAAAYRQQFTEALSQACTRAVATLFGDHLSVSIDAQGEVLVTQQMANGHTYTGKLQQSLGASIRNLVSFAIWLQLFWVLRQRNPDGCATVLWDEPFVNVSSHLLERASELIRGCAELGIQVIQTSIHPQTVPAGEDTVLIYAGDPKTQVL